MFDVLNTLTKINTRPIPDQEDTECPGCKAKGTLNRTYLLMGGPYSGLISCSACEWKQGVIEYLGRRMITVEPMPEPVGGLLYYLKEPDSE